MLQLNSVANVGAHRTCTPLYEKYEATPYNTFLDPSETGNIYSGMVMYRSGPDTVKLLSGATAITNTVVSGAQPQGTAAGPKAFGLSALDRNPNIDDVTQVGINSWAVWLGGPNAFFTLSAPAFDTTQSYAVPTDGSRAFLYASSTTNGQLTSAQGASNTAGWYPVAELIDVLGPTQIVIRFVNNVVFA